MKHFTEETKVQIVGGSYADRRGRIVGILGHVDYVGFCYKVKLEKTNKTVNISAQFLTEIKN